VPDPFKLRIGRARRANCRLQDELETVADEMQNGSLSSDSEALAGREQIVGPGRDY
jgi:hypothetical protein